MLIKDVHLIFERCARLLNHTVKRIEEQAKKAVRRVGIVVGIRRERDCARGLDQLRRLQQITSLRVPGPLSGILPWRDLVNVLWT